MNDKQEEKEAKLIRKEYNENMGYVDQFNKAFYDFWPKIKSLSAERHIRLSLLRMMIVNAFMLYKMMVNKDISQAQFLVDLMRECLG